MDFMLIMITERDAPGDPSVFAEMGKFAGELASQGKMRGGRRSYDPPSYVIVVGSVLLAVGLLAQIVHASRDSLATSELFNQTVAPIYRILGHRCHQSGT